MNLKGTSAQAAHARILGAVSAGRQRQLALSNGSLTGSALADALCEVYDQVVSEIEGVINGYTAALPLVIETKKTTLGSGGHRPDEHNPE